MRNTFGLVLLAVAWTIHAAGADEPATRSGLSKVRLSPDGHGFVTAAGDPFVPFGLTYFGTRIGWAPQVWKKFDAQAVRKDFARMKELGVNCARVFLSFGSFYQEPGKLSPEGLAKFDQMLAIAEEQGIYLHPTGPDHWEGLPEWAKGDRYADEKMLGALEEFWRLFIERYRGRTAIFAYDLLNEPEIRWDGPIMKQRWNAFLRGKYGTKDKIALAWGTAHKILELGEFEPPKAEDRPGDPELLEYQLFRESLADQWTRRQAAVIKRIDPQALVTVGLIQWSVPSLLPGVRHYSGFRPSRQAKFLDFMEVHFYPFDQGAYEYRDANEEAGNLAYLQTVVNEVAKTGKPVVLAEFGWYGGGKPRFDGGRHPAATEEQQARWCRRVVETTRGPVTGWLNWGLYDEPEATDTSEFSGLLTADGELKAWGREFARLAREYRNQTITPPKTFPGPQLDWDQCLTSTKAGTQFRRDYREWLEGRVAPPPAGR